MPFTAKSGKFSANINTLTMGTGDKAIVLGGENVLPFYTFDAPIENAPKDVPGGTTTTDQYRKRSCGCGRSSDRGLRM